MQVRQIILMGNSHMGVAAQDLRSVGQVTGASHGLGLGDVLGIHSSLECFKIRYVFSLIFQWSATIMYCSAAFPSVSVSIVSGSSYASLQRQKRNMSLKESWTAICHSRKGGCMHAEENKIDDISRMQPLIELKNL
jgi:hypothetical protein